MSNWTVQVYSTNVAQVGYDEATKSLIIHWVKGRISAYEGVPEELALELSKAPSVGSMLSTEIKGKFPHRYL